MKPTPKDWPRIASALFYDDAPKAIDWLCSAFGFTIRLKVEGDNGSIIHSELEYGDGLIMVGSTNRTDRKDRVHCISPQSVNGGNTQSLMAYVDDADAHCKHARAAGATIVNEPVVSDYGEEYWSDKCYEAIDPEGHHWWFCERLRSPKS